MSYRPSILTNLVESGTRNLFCSKKNLTNEASVETFFVNRLLDDLGFKDGQIKTKESIETFTISTGSKKKHYKPDYQVKNHKEILIIDAKAPDESLENWVEQCAHYCLILKRKKVEVRYFILTNGFKTALYEWDKEEAILELYFADFFNGGEKYEQFRKFIIRNSNASPIQVLENQKQVRLKRISKEDAQKIFLACHKKIWSAEKKSPESSFAEFIKLIFLKLWNDRRLHEQYTPNSDGTLVVPELSNVFSVKWIESRESDHPNPLNDIEFKKLLAHIQDDALKNKKKIFFDNDEKIRLKPNTIKNVVKKLEHVDLFGIDEDLNGRLFETFLNASMRGKALGQYFTPRSIVLLATKMADLQVSEKHADRVLDASCGTGGFLIEALTIMRNTVRTNNSYSQKQKESLINKIASECLFGVDAASDPKLAKIARINMYLHGDGGSHIYFADGLDKDLALPIDADRIFKEEHQEMINHFKPNSFDVVLTNPPFSMWYEMEDEEEKKILLKYELINKEGVSETRTRLRGSAMFLERYRDLLKTNGKLLSIIDETILSSDEYAYARDFIRENFIIRAIVSLHGDAFQQAKARVKTALIYLQKKSDPQEIQPSAFMCSSIRLGVDDMPVTTPKEKVNEARELADSEINKILENFKKFNDGQKGEWLVKPERLKNRLDVKSCVPMNGRFVSRWKAKNHQVFKLGDLCTPVEDIFCPHDFPTQEFSILEVGYNGRCKISEVRPGRNINFKRMVKVQTGDLIFSEYNSFNGAIGIATENVNDSLASTSYVVVRCKEKAIATYLWAILRTTELKCDLLTSAVGMGRQTICWDDIKDVEVPIAQSEIHKISEQIYDCWKKEEEANKGINAIQDFLAQTFDVEGEASKMRYASTKPPK